MRVGLLCGLWAAIATAGCTVEERTDAGSDLDGGLLRGFGEGCASTEDCASGLCLAVGPRSVCTDLCTDDGDCPAAANWACVEPEGLGARVCGCNGSSTTELCGNGRDDDCNGEVDECRICGGVPVAEDDPDHCGACGNACRGDQECSGGVCRCPAGSTDCAGACVDTDSSAAHCGTCGNACEPGTDCVGGTCECPSPELSRCPGIGCIDLSRSFVHCGSCGNRCPSGAVCRDGSCACTSTTATVCDGACVETESDPANCGGCGTACLPTEVCRGGTCACDTSTPDRCGTECVNVDADPANCGGCGVACASGAVCVSGTCFCPGGGRECSGTCYALGDEGNCGGCGRTCPTGQFCEDSTDACTCTLTGRAPCAGATCPDLFNDPLNCGGCGITCRPSEPCASGSCRCPTGTTYCAGVGCVSTASSPTNCGACGVACDPSQTCSSGVCRCPSGTTLCPGFGCVSTASHPMNCGACGVACTATGQTCSVGRCTCPAGAPTVCGGACVNTGTDSMNCGSCGNVCPSGTSCMGGTCRCPGASTGELYCPSIAACTNVLTSNAHCGACDRACPADATCMSGTCVCATPGYSACGTSCVDRQTDEANCGTCGRICTGSLVCLAGSCTCDPPVPGTAVRVTNAVDISENVAIAWNGTEGMLVWIDARTGVRQAFYRRLAADGSLIGSDTQVSAAPSFRSVTNVDVVWTGTEWGIAWTQYTGTSTNYDLHLARLAADGTPLDAPRVIAPSQPSAFQLELLYTSTLGYVAVRRLHTSVMLQSFGPTGVTPGMELPVFPSTAVAITAMGAAAAPTGDIGVVENRSGVQLQVVNADGSMTAGRVTVTTLFTDSIALAHDGTSWVATWSGSIDATNAGVLLARGSTLASRTTVISRPGTSMTAPRYRRPTLSLSGREAIVTWQATLSGAETVWRIEGRRYALPTTGAATALDTAASTYMATTSVFDQPHGMVTVPGGVILAWADTRWGATEVYEQLVSLPPCAP